MTFRWKRGLPAILASLMLAACGGGDSSSTPGEPGTGGNTPPGSVKQALEKLEREGASPALDRSATVRGTDGNADGVRDDIERLIASKTGTAEQKSSLRVFSRAVSAAMLVNVNDANALRAAANNVSNGVNCIWQHYPEDQADAMVREIEKFTVNTRERYTAYMAFNAAMHGAVSGAAQEANCA
jgi:hypothetical protein